MCAAPVMPSAADLTDAVAVLKRGGVIAYPTEAVFGLGCDPLDEAAVMRLLELKQRDVRKGMLLIAASFDQLADWVSVTPQQATFLREQWPYATSYLIAASDKVPAWIRGSHTKVGVRVTRHPVAAALCDAFGGPLVSTSANISGADPARTVAECHQQFNDRLDACVNGECDTHARPSTIIDLVSGEIIRA